jgi:hypothetical protein
MIAEGKSLDEIKAAIPPPAIANRPPSRHVCRVAVDGTHPHLVAIRNRTV